MAQLTKAQADKLVSQIDEWTRPDGMKTQPEGVGSSILEHLEKLKAAIVALDYRAITVEVRNLLNHLLSEEGMGASPDGMKAIPWATLLGIVFEIIRQFLDKDGTA
ncbi:MAG: hypothetical protein H7210_01105 [Pyrinomonadaceae bacterium]|nr:hypothetical protein [Phycisphaerales bacterium]